MILLGNAITAFQKRKKKMKNEEMVSFSINEIEKKIFINADYGTDDVSANKKIGREIVKVINTFEIAKGRECFFHTRVKNQVIKNLGEKIKIGNDLRVHLASNYVHEMINYQIKTFLFYKQYPQFLEMR